MSTIGLMYKEPRVFAHDANLIVVGAVNSTWNVNKKIKWPLNWAGIDVNNAGSGHDVGDTITVTTPSDGAAIAADRAEVTVSDTNALDVNSALSVSGDLLGGTTQIFNAATNTTYTGLEPGVSAGVTTSGAGTGLQMSLTVAGGVATVLTVTTAGTGYADGDTITFANGTFGGAANMIVTIGTGAVTDYSVSDVGQLYVVGDTADQVATSGAGIAFASDVSNIDIPNTQEAGCCLYVGAAAGIPLLQVIMDSAVIDLTQDTGYTAASTITFATVSAGSFLPIMVKQIVGTYSANDVLALY